MAYTTINKSTDYFNTKLYTGNGGTQSITGVGFQPDWTWIKERSSTSDHCLYDAVRGVTKRLESNTTDAEAAAANQLNAFGTDGFTTGDSGATNENSQTYASWNWLANGAGSANTDGSISSTVSANTTSGFSIVSWTSLASGSNYTVGHGLSAVPSMIILKGRHEANNWMVYHHKNTSSPETDYLMLDDTAATADYPVWNDTAPTSSVFSCGTWSGFDAGGTMIAYCFAEKKGFSKFGSYTGNGNADGSFIYTGFKPSFILAKRTDASAGWVLFDNKRIGYNGSGNYWLDAQNSEADQTDATGMFDQLSNGFKIRSTFGSRNASGGNYIYMAFGQSLVGSNNVPCTAR